MKDKIINYTIGFISKYNNYDKTKIEELEYGLVAIYLLVTKLIIISLICLILGIFNEMIIFTLIYIPIRAVSFGMHATKSWICLIFSTLMFVGLPFLAKHIVISASIKSILAIISIILLFKNTPADTHKRPIVNKNRRLFFKYLSVIVVIVYTFISLFITNQFIANVLLFTLLLQCCLTSPLVYKLFNLPYDNYKNYNLS